jgi:hypothetical protein
VQVSDYIETINQSTAGQFDGCVMTNMDALTIPAAGGVDSTGLIGGDFSNGNDGVVLKDRTKLEDIKGQKVHLVEPSVSHYLLARALSTINSLGIVDGLSAPGKYLDLKAGMDTLVTVSNCPQINNPCNAFQPTPVRMIVYGPS